MEYFRRRLRRDPGNLETRWLLNVASMTLGRYPGDVPPGVLIPPSAFESADDPGRFVDTARAMGLDAPGGAGGVVVDDVDGDGLFDVVVSSVDPCAPLRYYHHQGEGTFRDRRRRGKLEHFGLVGLVRLLGRVGSSLGIHRSSRLWALRLLGLVLRRSYHEGHGVA